MKKYDKVYLISLFFCCHKLVSRYVFYRLKKAKLIDFNYKLNSYLKLNQQYIHITDSTEKFELKIHFTKEGVFRVNYMWRNVFLTPDITLNQLANQIINLIKKTNKPRYPVNYENPYQLFSDINKLNQKSYVKEKLKLNLSASFNDNALITSLLLKKVINITKQHDYTINNKEFANNIIKLLKNWEKLTHLKIINISYEVLFSENNHDMIPYINLFFDSSYNNLDSIKSTIKTLESANFLYNNFNEELRANLKEVFNVNRKLNKK